MYIIYIYIINFIAMTDFYDHTLHNNIQYKLNNDISIKDLIYQTIELHNKLILDTGVYPYDQISLYDQRFLPKDISAVPELSISDYIMCINNYRINGYLFTLRYLNPIDLNGEVMFLNPNDNGQVLLLIFGNNLDKIKQIIKGTSINLTTDTIEGIYY